MKRDWRAAALAGAVLVVVGAAAYVVGHRTAPAAASPAAPTTATLTVVGATATIYGATATRTGDGTAPMPLTNLTDTVVVVIEATAGLGSCEIVAGGQRVAYTSTSQGQQTACIWNRLAPS